MIQFNSHSGIHTLQSIQKIPLDLNKAWDFFSSPNNLSVITPPDMGFKITSAEYSGPMYPGQIISYKVSPFKGIKSNWVTEITQVETGRYFIDEQRFGPYAMWHHEHWFKSIGGGIEMTDRVSYKVPLGILGNWANQWVIKRKLKQIFDYRYNKLIELFGTF